MQTLPVWSREQIECSVECNAKLLNAKFQCGKLNVDTPRLVTSGMASEWVDSKLAIPVSVCCLLWSKSVRQRIQSDLRNVEALATLGRYIATALGLQSKSLTISSDALSN